MKRSETQTCSATYHNKVMYQVSVEYVKGYGGKKSLKKHRWDGQMESKPIVSSSETGRGLITRTADYNCRQLYWVPNDACSNDNAIL